MNTSCERPVRNNPSRLQTSLWFLLGIALLSPSSVAEISNCLWADGSDANLTLVYEVVPVSAEAAELSARGLHRERMAADAGDRTRQRRALLAHKAPCLVPLASTQSTNVSLVEGSSATLPCFVLLRADHMVRIYPSAPPPPPPQAVRLMHFANGTQVSWWRHAYRYPLLVGRDRIVLDHRFRSPTWASASSSQSQFPHLSASTSTSSSPSPSDARILSVQLRAVDDWKPRNRCTSPVRQRLVQLPHQLTPAACAPFPAACGASTSGAGAGDEAPQKYEYQQLRCTAAGTASERRSARCEPSGRCPVSRYNSDG